MQTKVVTTSFKVARRQKLSPLVTTGPISALCDALVRTKTYEDLTKTLRYWWLSKLPKINLVKTVTINLRSQFSYLKISILITVPFTAVITLWYFSAICKRKFTEHRYRWSQSAGAVWWTVWTCWDRRLRSHRAPVHALYTSSQSSDRRRSTDEPPTYSTTNASSSRLSSHKFSPASESDFQLENIGSRIDMQTHAGNGGSTAAHYAVTSNRATVTVFVTVWSWPLTFWPMGQCMPSDCYRVYMYQVWCW